MRAATIARRRVALLPLAAPRCRARSRLFAARVGQPGDLVRGCHLMGRVMRGYASDSSAPRGEMCRDEPLLWLGLGSNLLISDTGLPGTVIQTTGRLTRMETLEPPRLRCGLVFGNPPPGDHAARLIEVARTSGIRLIPEVRRVGALT